jgi:acetylornithine deacetylase/succinyl-diaminopimelate desuccinylase-like protein
MKLVLDYLRQHQARMVRELCDYVRFPSVSAQADHKPDLLACARWLVDWCQNAGLRARLCPTDGHPVVVATTRTSRRPTKPHYLVYGHYDVQPPEPFDLWHSKPFEPRIEGCNLHGRGASDNKGQNFAHLCAVQAFLQTRTELACDITFVIEGEEEVGSRSLAQFLKSNSRELACEAVIVSDTGMPDKTHPALTYALRGIVSLEVTVHGPSRDLHSGIFGGSVDNPALVLAQLLAQLRDNKGRVTVPGFYDDVKPLTALERSESRRLPFDAEAYRKFLGVPALFGEAGFTPLEQRAARPTLEINGLTSGYQGEGSKTIIPAWARAKLTLRLVPNQKPDRVARLLIRHLRKQCPRTVRLESQPGHGADPYVTSPTGPLARAGLAALRKAFGRDPVLLREGGSIPIVNQFRKVLGADTLLLGLALPDDNAHSPNEKFDLDCFAKGQVMSAWLWQELTEKRGNG